VPLHGGFVGVAMQVVKIANLETTTTTFIQATITTPSFDDGI